MLEFDRKWSADDVTINLPLRWRKPSRVRVSADMFHESVPDEWIDRVFAVIALAPRHTFQILTKRGKRMREYMTRELTGPWAGRVTRVGDDNVPRPETAVGFRMRTVVTDMLCTVNADALNRAIDFMDKRDGGEGDGFFRRWPLPNVWLGVSTEDQPRADERIPDLLATPAAMRFVSYEPALGPVDFGRIKAPRYTDDDDGWVLNALQTGDYYELYDGKRRVDSGDGPMRWHRLDWIVCGGESGPGSRPMQIGWARSVRDQCADAGVAFFMKQMSGTSKARMPAIPDDLMIRETPNAAS